MTTYDDEVGDRPRLSRPPRDGPGDPTEKLARANQRERLTVSLKSDEKNSFFLKQTTKETEYERLFVPR